MNVIFLEAASSEFSEAFAYYESIQPGLGERFEEEIARALGWLVDHPNALPLRRDAYRRLNLRIFPYYIPYVVRGSSLGRGSGTRATDAGVLDQKDREG